MGAGGSSISSSSMRSQQHYKLKTYLKVDFSIIDSVSHGNEELNILQWLQMCQVRFLVLSKLAHDISTIPVSTVSSKSAFSVARRIIEERRTSLTSEIVKVLNVLKIGNILIKECNIQSKNTMKIWSINSKIYMSLKMMLPRGRGFKCKLYICNYNNFKCNNKDYTLFFLIKVLS